MNDMNKQILDLINVGASLNEIEEVSKLTHKQLLDRLNLIKNQGFNFIEKYYYDGEIVYKSVKEFEKESESKTILTKSSDTKFRALIISDIHLANSMERLDALSLAYDYCIKEGIHIIINGGDLIDGLVGISPRKCETFEEQINYAIKHHPYDKNIINFVCLGNHDYNSLKTVGQDIRTLIESKRSDIVSLGYGEGSINVKNDSIIVKHPSTPISNEDRKNGSLIISGHSHKMKTIATNGIFHIHVPSLSDLRFHEDETFPSMIKASINFDKGYFKIASFDHLIIHNNKVCKIGEQQYNFITGKNPNSKSIKNIEDRKTYKEKVKTLE